MNMFDSTAPPPSEGDEELVARQLSTHRGELCELLVEAEKASDGSLDVALQALGQGCAERTTSGSSYWRLAALDMEDRAVRLAETWLDDQDLPPVRRERVVELLDGVPGYWPLYGLDDAQAEQVISRRGIASSPPLMTATLGFVLAMLTLVDQPQDRERILAS